MTYFWRKATPANDSDIALELSNLSDRQRKIVDVTNNTTQPSAQVLTTATYKEIQFDSMGRAMIVGQPDLPVYVWVENTQLAATHPFRRSRLDISPLTGFVQFREIW